MMRKTRGQLLSEAMKATLVEDHGYRAVLHEPEHGFLRYHVSNGLQRVTKSGKQWRLIETVLTAEDVDRFLQELGLLSADKPTLDLIAEHLGGDIKERFTSGGGVFKLEGLDVRYSPITGLDFVQLSLSKWVRQRKILYIKDLTTLLAEGKWEELNSVYRRERDNLRADRGGSSERDRASEEAEGPEAGVSEEA